MKIAFDEAKRARTLLERGLDFADAGDTRRIISMRYAHDEEAEGFGLRLD